MNRRLPSEEMALKLLEHVRCSRRVVAHCRAVADCAAEIAEACKKKGFEVDIDLVRVGGLLHDLGRAKTHGVEHGIVGAKIARNSNLPRTLTSIIECHVGSGISKDEAERLGWPVKSYIPESLEGRIVAYADKLVEGSTRKPFKEAVRRFRQDRQIPNASVARLKFWHEELCVCLE